MLTILQCTAQSPEPGITEQRPGGGNPPPECDYGPTEQPTDLSVSKLVQQLLSNNVLLQRKL